MLKKKTIQGYPRKVCTYWRKFCQDDRDCPEENAYFQKELLSAARPLILVGRR